MTTPTPVPVDVTNSVTLEPFPDSSVQKIAAIGLMVALVLAIALIGLAMVTHTDVPGEFWPVVGTLAGGPLLLLQRR